MGRKTVRWNKLKDPKYGSSSCEKCGNTGMIQEYDRVFGMTSYYYCDCYFGQKAKQELERNSHEIN